MPDWKARHILSNMETSGTPAPTPEEASAALTEAEESLIRVAGVIALPSHFHSSIGAAIAVQIATAAVGAAVHTTLARLVLVAGLVVFGVVAAVQLVRFRRLNGVWVGGLASRVVFGTASSASTAYSLGMAAAVWAAFESTWWLVLLGALAGGVGYDLSGRRWVRLFRGDPATHSRGESALWLAVLVVLAVAGLVLLVAAR